MNFMLTWWSEYSVFMMLSSTCNDKFILLIKASQQNSQAMKNRNELHFPVLHLSDSEGVLRSQEWQKCYLVYCIKFLWKLSGNLENENSQIETILQS